METKIIGHKIGEARKKINISQAQLAQRMFISAQAVGKWERGESMPDIITFNRLAEILGVDLNYFSDNFQSVAKVTAPIGSLDQPLAELPPGKAADKTGKKPGWDMSRGNWVDADFSGLKNLHEKFSASNLQRCLFVGSDLSGLLLKSNNVERCDFSGSDISGSHIQNSNLAGNLFKDCSLKETEFSGSNFSCCNFSNAQFAGANFLKNNHLERCDFSSSNLSSSRIQSSSFSGNQFKSSSLKETEFSGSDIRACDFTDADFSGATFKSCAFVKNTIANALWNRTSFIATGIANVVFEGTLEDCYFEDCTFNRVTFQHSTLMNTFFKSNSLKRIVFIDCKVDQLTYAFLKNGKADLTGITLIS